MERGSVLILTLMAVLILSLMVTSLLTVGTTEMHTTQNYHMSKVSHYYAQEGLELLKNYIATSEDPPALTLPSTTVVQGGITKNFQIGTIIDRQQNISDEIGIFQGFPPPPLTGMSLGSNSNIVPVVWEVLITSEVAQGLKKTYTELISGVYSIMKEY